MRTILAIAAMLALTSGAEAYCYSVPDTAQSAYVQNNMQRTICIQQELGQSLDAKAQQVQIDATIGKLQRDALQQKLLLQQLATQSLLNQLD